MHWSPFCSPTAPCGKTQLWHYPSCSSSRWTLIQVLLLMTSAAGGGQTISSVRMRSWQRACVISRLFRRSENAARLHDFIRCLVSNCTQSSHVIHIFKRSVLASKCLEGDKNKVAATYPGRVGGGNTRIGVLSSAWERYQQGVGALCDLGTDWRHRWLFEKKCFFALYGTFRTSKMRFVLQLTHGQGLVHLKTTKADRSALQHKYVRTNTWNTRFNASQ